VDEGDFQPPHNPRLRMAYIPGLKAGVLRHGDKIKCLQKPFRGAAQAEMGEATCTWFGMGSDKELRFAMGC